MRAGLLLAALATLAACGASGRGGGLADDGTALVVPHDDGTDDYTLGVAYETGQGVEVDLARAAARYRKACEGHAHVRACNNLGVLEDAGSGVPVDHAAARIHFARACQGDLGEGCFNLGMALVDPGDGTPPDAVHARSAFDRGCAHDHVDSCVNAALLWFRGQGGSANPDVGKARLTRACELGDGHACATLKEL